MFDDQQDKDSEHTSTSTSINLYFEKKNILAFIMTKSESVQEIPKISNTEIIK